MEFEISKSYEIRTKTGSTNDVAVLNKNISYEEFFEHFIHLNLPCILKNVTEHWEANALWVQNDIINLEYLKNRYGSCEITVYDCGEKYYNSHRTENYKFSNFVDKWGRADSSLKYLKDWHLKNEFKDDDFYQVPLYFASDWLNEFLTANLEDDYRFVYMGQAGTWTPFHADVFSSFSWSANVCGRKKWILFPPDEENQFRDSLNNLPFDVGHVSADRRHFELTQEAGDAIFVPSGWYHQVWNLKDTISINHNWVNGCNILHVWLAIERNYESVKHELEDCQDMDGFIQQCQVVLNASFGMDFNKLYKFLEFIALKRLEQLGKNEAEQLFHGHLLGVKHAAFDLKAVGAVLEKFASHCDVDDVFIGAEKSPKILLEKIRHAM